MSLEKTFPISKFAKNKKPMNCLECGEDISYGGRTDRKFCSETCKNKYHNRNHNNTKYLKEKVIRILERNYSILERLLEEKAVSVSLGDLAQWGFNDSYMTSCTKSNHHEEDRCFDIKYYRTATRIFGLERVLPISRRNHIEAG